MLKRLLVSFGLSGVTLVVAFLSQILSVPVLLSHWGATQYGEWLTLTGLASSLSIMNFGVQSYVCNLLISTYTRREIEKGTRLLQSALYLYVLFTGLSVIMVIVLGVTPGLLEWMKIEQISSLDGRAILVIYGLLAAYAIPGGLLLSLFQVTKQMPRQLAYGLSERVILLVIPLLVALCGRQPITAAIFVVILACVLIIIELQDVRRRSPFIIGLSHADRSLAFSFIKPGLMFFAVSLISLAMTTGITILLANHSGGQAVALFSTTLILGNFARTLVNQGMNVLWPEITEAGVLKKTSDRLLRWYFLLIKLVTVFIFIFVIGVCAFGCDILTIWTRGGIEIDAVLILLLSIYLAIQAPNLVNSAFGMALNRQDDLLAIQLTAGIITLGLGVFLIHEHGSHGAAIALMLGQVFIVGKSFKYAFGWIGADWQSFPLKVFPYLAGSFVLTVAVSIVLSDVSRTLPERFFLAIVAVAAVLVILWRLWLENVEKKLLLDVMFSLRKRNPNNGEK